MKTTFIYLILPITSVSFSGQDIFRSINSIQNNLLSYGRFCGAGPDHSMWHTFRPIDDFDKTCQQHDADYQTCFQSLPAQVGVFLLPTLINQLMAIRGWIPFSNSMKQLFFQKYKPYFHCMNAADEKFIHAIQQRLQKKLYPLWWNHLELAPPEIESTQYYTEACSFGLPSLGYCIVSTRDFFHLVIKFFQVSTKSDIPFLLTL